MEQIVLETDRLVLESITPNIINYLFENKSEIEIKTYFGIDEQRFLHLNEMYKKGTEMNNISLFYFLLIEKESQLPVGECGFHTWNLKHRRADVFYNMYNPLFKRKGLMKEALNRILNYGFLELNLHRVQAFVDKQNTPSVKLLQHFTFLKEGTAREDYKVNGTNEDSECYSLLKWEWEKITK